MAKILTNTTGSDILVQDTGVYIAAGASYTIDAPTFLLWVESNDITSYVTSGDIVVGDGFQTFAPADGLRYIRYPDRQNIQSSGSDVVKVNTTLNFTGNATVVDNGNGKATIDIGFGTSTELLREVTTVLYPFGYVNTFSDLLFEADPVNGTIKFLTEVTI